MEFNELASQFNSGIKAIASKHRPQCGFIDAQDLAQEALLSLWLKWKAGSLKDKNKSYILKGCYFEMKNFLRKSLDAVTPVSLDVPIDEEGATLKEIIPDARLNDDHSIEVNFLIDAIRNDGLTTREKEVFEYFLLGLNTRQIGRKLGISHVRVVKIEKNIWAKTRAKLKNSDL
ncbi:MAG: sigma-70 family RNA polymerase sigma factor [Candidatus Omnitrophota bacterium]|nr:sigma-70 family RNA polymerase sigma factor [Candidatus Omnitrophota bacterium]